jgi:hypothetical protein
MKLPSDFADPNKEVDGLFEINPQYSNFMFARAADMYTTSAPEFDVIILYWNLELLSSLSSKHIAEP